MILYTRKNFSFDTGILTALAVAGILFLSFSIWAVFDISKRKSITRKEKSALTFLVALWPVYGVLVYAFKIRPRLSKD